MKFTIEKGAAEAAMNAVHAIVIRKTTIPILTNFRIATEDGAVLITATDLDMQGSIRVDADVETHGTITLSADKLRDIIKSIPDGADLAVSFGDEDGRVVVRSGRSRFLVPALPAIDFPLFGNDDAAVRFRITAGAVARLIDEGAFSMAADDPRDYFNCAYLHTPPGPDGPVALRMVSTQGHRLSYCEAPPPAGVTMEPGAMIPNKVVGTLRRLVGIVAHDEEIELSFSRTKMSAEIGRTELVSKLLDDSGGGYPEYPRIIPSAMLGTVVIDTDLFMAALRRVMIMAEPKLGYTVNMRIEDGKLSMAARNQETGQSDEEVEAEWSGPEAYDFAVEGPNLLDFLTHIRTESTILRISQNRLGMPITETGEPDWFGMVAPNKR